MEKVGFRVQLNIDRLEAYKEHHKNVWPEMLQALTETGWTNYSLFLDETDGTLFGYFETPNYEEALKNMATKEVNDRWQEMMSDFFANTSGKRPDEGFLRLVQVFYLP